MAELGSKDEFWSCDSRGSGKSLALAQEGREAKLEEQLTTSRPPRPSKLGPQPFSDHNQGVEAVEALLSGSRPGGKSWP